MTKSGHARKDLVSRLRPDEGRRARVGQLDISPDGGFQLAPLIKYVGCAGPSSSVLMLGERLWPGPE